MTEKSPPRSVRRTQRLKPAFSGFFLCVLCVLRGGDFFVAASDLTGRWVWRVPNGDGTFRETVFVLSADGPVLTGSVISPTSEQPFIEGGIDGNSFHFATLTGPLANRRRTEYRGVLAAPDEVHITIVRSDRPDQNAVAMRGSDSAGRTPARIEP